MLNFDVRVFLQKNGFGSSLFFVKDVYVYIFGRTSVFIPTGHFSVRGADILATSAQELAIYHTAGYRKPDFDFLSEGFGFRWVRNVSLSPCGRGIQANYKKGSCFFLYFCWTLTIHILSVGQ